MIAARSPRPNVGKKQPPKSPSFAAMSTFDAVCKASAGTGARARRGGERRDDRKRSARRRAAVEHTTAARSWRAIFNGGNGKGRGTAGEWRRTA